MQKKTIPKYQGLRIYFSSTILYLFLVLPFVGFLILQNIPEHLISDGNVSWNWEDEEITQNPDSIIKVNIDSSVADTANDIELQEHIVTNADSNQSIAEEQITGTPIEKKDAGNNRFLGKFLGLYFKMLLISFLIGLLFNLPFKLYLRQKRRGKSISVKLETFCKKFILHTAKINASILLLPHLVSHTLAVVLLFSGGNKEFIIESKLFNDFFYVSVTAALLTILFVYFWQKNRVHLHYIEYFFTAEELKKRIFKTRRGKIGHQLWLSSILTTTFPIAIVVLYFFLSLTSVKELQIENLSVEHREVLLGKWYNIMKATNSSIDNSSFEKLYFVTVIDNIVMFVGMGTGIFVSFFYLLRVLKWNTRSIVKPVNELLNNMKKIQKDGATDYTIVRTNDEVGELTEGFNVMIGKIKNYISSIKQMNVDLERRVVERTKEVVDQKEEIESQKEEIMSQLEMVTEQKDTIENQQYQILDSIHYAKRIQTAMLPPKDLLAHNLKDHFVLYKPRDIVSGDFYWHAIKGDKTYIAVADCTGHGVPGAFLSILGISYLNEIVNKNTAQTTADILGQLRKSLIYSLHQKGEEGEAQDGLEIALCVLDLKKKTLQYSGARRPLYIARTIAEAKKTKMATNDKILIETNEKYQLLQFKPDSMPIGIYDEKEQDFTSHEIKVNPGDSIYLFTDGYVDQMGGKNRKTFRVKRLKKLLFDIQGKSMNEQHKILDDTNIEWQGKFEQIDDMLFIGLQV